MRAVEQIEKKIMSLAQAKVFMQACKTTGKTVAFTNGCFDLLHLGHITYLAEAASLGDKLFVAVNDDASVRALEKGENRPINPELARAIVLAALGVVDHVILFSEDTPLNTILAIKPDLIVKGGDYDAALSDPTDKRYIVGKNEAEVWGGSAQTIPLVEGYSTTGLLAKR